jgi:outer membrane protein OmpA-like peptidoglycan-associated protein
VQLRAADGILSATGSASHQWVLQARRAVGAMPGIRTFDTGGLTDEGTAAVAVVQQRLEQIVLRFDPGAAEPPPSEEAAFDAAVATLQELAKAASAGGVSIRVDVVGHTDGTGSEGTNVRLSRARAEWALSAIEARGIRGVPLALVGAGSSDPLRPGESDEDQFFNRSVRFRVRVE